jgi:hypothetical protein
MLRNAALEQPQQIADLTSVGNDGFSPERANPRRVRSMHQGGYPEQLRGNAGTPVHEMGKFRFCIEAIAFFRIFFVRKIAITL